MTEKRAAALARALSRSWVPILDRIPFPGDEEEHAHRVRRDSRPQLVKPASKSSDLFGGEARES